MNRRGNATEIDAALARLASSGVDGLIVGHAGPHFARRERICAFAREHRLAAIERRREFAEAGCLVTYGPNLAANWCRAARYVDRILRGARPADLPVEQPTVLELVVNLGTATTLGLTLPQSLVNRAGQIIQ